MKCEQALEVLKKYVNGPNLIKHALAVSAVMKHFARIEGEDEEFWGAVGLLHDVDWELYPQDHCKKCAEILKNEGFDNKFIHAVASHGYGICADVEPQSYMENVLFTIDELTGLITACALVRPEKKLAAVDIDSVKKKWGKKEFAAGANRAVIEKGATRMGRDLDFVIANTLTAMQSSADLLGL